MTVKCGHGVDIGIHCDGCEANPPLLQPRYDEVWAKGVASLDDSDDDMAKIVLEAHDPYGRGNVVLGYDEHGSLYLEVRLESLGGVEGFARATFSSNPKYLRRFLRDAHEAEPP